MAAAQNARPKWLLLLLLTLSILFLALRLFSCFLFLISLSFTFLSISLLLITPLCLSLFLSPNYPPSLPSSVLGLSHPSGLAPYPENSDAGERVMGRGERCFSGSTDADVLAHFANHCRSLMFDDGDDQSRQIE